MSKVREKIKLTSYDELLKVETTDGLKEIDIDKLYDFSNHPFKVSDDEKMEELTESNIYEFEYWKFVMARNKEEYEGFVDKVTEHSLWRQGNKLKYGEQMLMLSTCDNGKGDDWRIVVISKEKYKCPK